MPNQCSYFPGPAYFVGPGVDDKTFLTRVPTIGSRLPSQVLSPIPRGLMWVCSCWTRTSDVFSHHSVIKCTRVSNPCSNLPLGPCMTWSFFRDSPNTNVHFTHANFIPHCSASQPFCQLQLFISILKLRMIILKTFRTATKLNLGATDNA